MVERWKNQRFKDHLCPCPQGTSLLRTRTEMVLETLVFSPLNHLTRLIAWENLIIFSRQESNKSHFRNHVYIHLFISLLIKLMVTISQAG
jgi:hypothetical protein